jgi:xanthine dehydrogenase accessory factor
VSSDLFVQLDRLRERAGRAAVATLVATRGTTPRKEGARMGVDEHGRVLGSVTIGGCVDAEVIAAAERVLATGAPQLLSLSLGDEDAWDLGLTCAGTVDVLIEPLDFARPGDPALAAYEAVRAEVGAGRRAVAVTPLAGDGGSAHRRLVLGEHGAVFGTLGGAALDAAAAEVAREILGAAGGAAASSGARTIAGGRLRAYFELHEPVPTVLVFGAGHVAMSLVPMVKELGWRAVVVDGRERFATRDRFPLADEVVAGIPSEVAERYRYDAATFVVLVAHDYKYEVPVLRTVLRQSPAYVGLLGSRRRGRAILQFLREEPGLDERALASVRVPVGLDLGGRTAAEIALSIAAEMVAVRAGRMGVRPAASLAAAPAGA